MLTFYLSIIQSENDKVKFEKLYVKYKRLMHFIANGILHDEYLAEDAVQSAFIRIIKHLDKIDDTSCNNTKGFMAIIVENVAKDLYRKRKKNYSVSYDESKEELIDYTSVEDTLISQLRLDDLISEIGLLPEIYRDTLMLRYIHGCSDKEIANITNANHVTVRKRLERAKQKLSSRLNKEVI